ncbi:MAG TPA: phospholipid carrier-dependent glycosyltransferase [Thermoanaerobaculia bacterium]|nr:phospholipid carrier-dependent glycosyltransferase [Thermoanaerobaculia bacterium]
MRSSAALLVLLLVVVVSLSVGSVRLDSATSDEPAHIVNGVIKVSERWLGFFPEQPPLMNSLSALPVVLAGFRVEPGWKGRNHWAVGRHFLYDSGFDAYRILFLARLPTIALLAALVAVMYWFVLRQTGSGPWALAAAALTGFCPNLMAHGRLATVDLALAFFSFTATALLISLMTRPAAPAAIAFGITAAAAAMSKISGLILAPYFALVVAGAFAFGRIPDRRRFLRSLAIAVVAALVFFEAVGLAETGSTFAREQYPATPLLLIPFAEYAANIRTISDWYAGGYRLPQFLLGEFSRDGWPHYYLVALLLKTPIPAIVLFIAAVVAGIRRRSFVLLALLSFIVLFLAVAATGHLALGVRYVLPVYPFIYAATIIAVSSTGLGRAGVAVVIVLIAWHIGENVKTYPSYIAYFNQLIGSHRNADKFLIDSNLDWGQDLRRLDAWAHAQGVKQIAVHYFGGGSVEYEIRSAEPVVRRAPGPVPLPGGYFALSRHFYRVSFDPSVWGIDYDAVLAAMRARRVTTIGGSIDVYRVGEETASPAPTHSYSQ